MEKIVICDLDHKDIAPEMAVLDKAGYEYKWLKCQSQEEVIEKCKGATVLLNQYVRMDEKIFSCKKRLAALKHKRDFGIFSAEIKNVFYQVFCGFG